MLYLIDSICKNVGGSYITNFARNMVNVFLDAYTLTDATVKKSFERLLQTWKNGMPGGNPVFPRHIIESIERSIVYIREKAPNPRYPHNNSSTPSLPHNNNNSSSNNNNPNSAIHVNPNFVNKVTYIHYIFNSANKERNRSQELVLEILVIEALKLSQTRCLLHPPIYSLSYKLYFLQHKPLSFQSRTQYHKSSTK